MLCVFMVENKLLLIKKQKIKLKYYSFLMYGLVSAFRLKNLTN